jgi:hypothetical protein
MLVAAAVSCPVVVVGRVASRYLSRLLAVAVLIEDLEAKRERRVVSCSLDLFIFFRLLNMSSAGS